jgi:hypothetical protein
MATINPETDGSLETARTNDHVSKVALPVCKGSWVTRPGNEGFS